MKKKIIFYIPWSVHEDRPTGTGVRPTRMFEAFSSLDIDVYKISGDTKERTALIDEYRWLLDDPSLIGIYAESSTLPIGLTDEDHLPRRPFMDYRFFRLARKKNVRVSLFYRDVHWRFDKYRQQVPLYKRILMRPFYELELKQFASCLDIVFLPSLEMAVHIPEITDHVEPLALPPGGIIKGSKVGDRGYLDKPVVALYVGGVGVGVYDIRPMLKTFEEVPAVNLKLVCREREWSNFQSHCGYQASSNVEILHIRGEDLDVLYEDIDFFCDLREPHRYLNFSMPIKIFEAIGHGKPVVTFEGTPYADLIKAEGLGWVVKDIGEAASLIDSFTVDGEGLSLKRSNLMQRRQNHTWLARAKQVISALNYNQA